MTLLDCKKAGIKFQNTSTQSFYIFSADDVFLYAQEDKKDIFDYDKVPERYMKYDILEIVNSDNDLCIVIDKIYNPREEIEAVE